MPPFSGRLLGFSFANASPRLEERRRCLFSPWVVRVAGGGDLLRLGFAKSDDGCQLLERGGGVGELNGAGVCDGWTSVDIAVEW